MRLFSALVISACIASSSAFAAAPAPPVAAQPVDPLEAIIPADCLALIEAQDTANIADAVMKSPVGRALEASETIQGLLQAGTGAARVAGMMLTGTPLSKLGEIFNGYTAIVLLDMPRRGAIPSIVLVAHVANRGARLEEILGTRLQPALADMNPDITVDVTRHEDVTITTLSEKGKPGISYAFVGAYCLAGSEPGVRKFISKFKAGVPTLASNADFKAARKALDVGTGITAWLNVKALMAAMSERIENNQRLKNRLAGAGVDSIRSIGWGMKFTKNAVHERIYIQTDPIRTGALKLLPDARKAPFGGAKFVPRNFTAFAAINLGSGKMVWERVREMIREEGGPNALEGFDQFLRAGIEAQLGFDTLDGLVAPLAGEIFVAADARKWGEIVKTGAAPSTTNVPFFFGAKLADKDTFERTILQILRSNIVWEQLKVETVASKYNNVDIRVLKIPDVPGLSPSFAFIDDYVLISMQEATLKAAIDAAANKDSLAARSDYAALAAIAPDAGFARIFGDLKGMLPGLLAGVRDDLPQPLAQLAPELMSICEKLGPALIALDATPGGIRVDIVTPLGTPGMIAIVGIIADSANRTSARIVTERLAAVGEKLEAYKADNGKYPRKLADLVPKYVAELPRDVFGEGDKVFAYSPGPLTRADDGTMVNITGWLLASPGPDKKLDIEIDTFTPASWEKLMRGDDIANLKRLIYRYKPELYKDEDKADDEGDLFLVGPVKQ